jgi:patatin-like phospholipase/acyl hydrolase
VEKESFRIISMDGGNGLFTALLLRELSAAVQQKTQSKTAPPIIANANLLAGTSAGGINALLLAQQESPDDHLQELTHDWIEILASLLPQPGHAALPPNPLLFPAKVILDLLQAGASLAATVSGWRSVLDNSALQQVVKKHLGQTTLGDLRQAVVVVSFQLDNEDPAPQQRRWKPRLFNNFRGSDDRGELCADVAVRTSAQPVMLPIFQSSTGQGCGYVDGAYVANNPTMAGLAEMANFVRKQDDSGTVASEPWDVASVQVLSIGAGVRQMFPSPNNYLGPPQVQYQNGSAHWGYLPWLLNPTAPFTLLNMFLQSASEEVDFQARALLGAENLHRLAPRSVSETDGADAVKASLNEPSTRDQIDAAAQWLCDRNWVTPGSPMAMRTMFV